MVRGVYTAASGMVAEQRRLDVVANNIANINTNGYKKDDAIFRAAPEEPFFRLKDPLKLPWVKFTVERIPKIGWSGSGVRPDEVFTNHQSGGLKQTWNPLDLAVVGDGFFTVQTPQGTRYTRDGAFILDGQRRLSTVDGFLVMGQKGPITIKGNSVKFGPDGTVQVDGETVDTLRMAQFDEPYRELKKIGDNLFVSNYGTEKPAKDIRVMAGYLEASNVNAVKEMVDMIRAMRAYETNQRMVTAQDGTIDKAINTVGIVK